MKTKISDDQCSAASLYWMQILTGDLKPKALLVSKQALPSFMAAMELDNKKRILQKLAVQNPHWATLFRDALHDLLAKSDNSIYLSLEYEPHSLLRQAATQAGIPESLFPTGKLTMYFDTKNHLIIEDETIDAMDFIKSTAQKFVACL